MPFSRLTPVALIAALALAGCGGGDVGQRFPNLPSDRGVLDAAQTNAFRTMEHGTFIDAFIAYPADDGLHKVPVGEYLASTIAKAFPRTAEVDKLRMRRFDAVCEEQGFFSSTVSCQVAGAFTFRLYNRPQALEFSFATELGERVERDEAVFTVSDPIAQADPLARQLRALIDLSGREFSEALEPILVEQNRRQFF